MLRIARRARGPGQAHDVLEAEVTVGGRADSRATDDTGIDGGEQE